MRAAAHQIVPCARIRAQSRFVLNVKKRLLCRFLSPYAPPFSPQRQVVFTPLDNPVWTTQDYTSIATEGILAGTNVGRTTSGKKRKNTQSVCFLTCLATLGAVLLCQPIHHAQVGRLRGLRFRCRLYGCYPCPFILFRHARGS